MPSAVAATSFSGDVWMCTCSKVMGKKTIKTKEL